MVLTPFDLRAMAAVLAQGRHLRTLSLGLLGLSAGWLVLVAAGVAAPLAVVTLVCLALSVVGGLVAIYFAARVDLDVRLLEGLAAHVDPAQSTAALDEALRSLGLVPAVRGGRAWSARWRGMKRLLARLALCLVLQGLLVVASGVTASSSVCDAPRRASVASRGEG